MDARFACILLAAGTGSRMGAAVPKQYLRVAGRTLLELALEHLAREPRIAWIVPVFAPGDATGPAIVARHRMRARLLPPVPGGAVRAASMLAGLRALPGEAAWVAVHDAARPIPSRALLARVLDAALAHGAAVPGLPVADTIKEVDERGFVRRTLVRARLRAVQTPQAARRDWLEQAARCAADAPGRFTDDASLLEAAGLPVFVCEGDPDNRKITTPEDLAWLQSRLSASDRASTPTASPTDAG